MEDLSKKKVHKPLDMFTKRTQELKELIKKYPKYPIVVICNSDVVCEDDGSWWYAPEIRFAVGEILDCYTDINDEKIYTDRDDFEEDVQYFVENYDNLEDMTDEEFDAEIKRIIQEYEPYWKKVIAIYADV